MNILKILCLFVFLGVVKFTSAQSPTAFMNNGGRTKLLAGGESGFNPWIGAQLVHNFQGTDEFADNIIVAGKMVYEIKNESEKFKLPVFTNLSDLKSELLNDGEKLENAVTDIVNGDQGLNVGVYPYFILDDYGDDFYCVIHGSASWKLNGFQLDTATTEYLNIGRLSVGIEIGYGILNQATGDKPVTLSFTPVYSTFNSDDYESIFQEKKSSIMSYELTGIVPISNTGIGVMLQQVFNPEGENAFMAGLILTAKNNN